MNKEVLNCSIDKLFINLNKDLEGESNFFQTKTIIFPSKEMINYFKAKWLKTFDTVLININLVCIDDFLYELFDLDKYYRLININQLVLLILKHINEDKFIHLLDKVEKDYIIDKSGKFIESHAYDFAKQLAILISSYYLDNFIPSNKFLIYLMNALKSDYYNYQIAPLSFLFDIKNRYKKNFNKLFLFGFSSLDPLYKKIIDDYALEHEVIFYKVITNDEINKNKVSVFTAPSKEKEIEFVHSEILKNIQKGKYQYNDFLVLAPNINEYESVINKVFVQDNINFPSVPFSLNSFVLTKTDTLNFLKKIYEILNKGFFTRLDVYELLNNRLIMDVRGIDLESINIYKETVINTNTYIDDDKDFDDFTYIKERLLVAKLVSVNKFADDIVELKNKQIMPYANLSLTDDLITKFINIIDDLQYFLKTLQNIKCINEQAIIQIKTELNKWVSLKDDDGNESNKVYIKINKILDNYLSYSIPDNIFSLDTFFSLLFDNSGLSSLANNDIFFNGVTFLSLDSKAIYSNKFIFVIGLSSNNYPINKNFYELDERNDDNALNIINQLNNLFSLFSNSEIKFYVSYVNKDLKSDEDFYPSTFINELMYKSNLGKSEIINMELDETRPYKELFTKKEFKDKGYFDSLLNKQLNPQINKSLLENQKISLNNQVRLKQICDFLCEPFTCKVNSVLGNEFNDDLNSNNEYPSLSVDKLTISKAVNVISKQMFLNQFEKSKMKKLFILNRFIYSFDRSIADKIFDKLCLESEKIINVITSTCPGKPEICTLDDFLFINEDEELVTISFQDEVIRYVGFNDERYYYSFKNLSDEESKNSNKDNPKINNKNFIDLYTKSLLDVASLTNEKEYKIFLIRNSLDYRINFNLTPSLAKETLIKIYKEMNNYSHLFYFDINFFDSPPKDFAALVDSLKQKRYLSENIKLFNFYKDLGYNVQDFKSQFIDYMNIMKEFLLYLADSTLNKKGENIND